MTKDRRTEDSPCIASVKSELLGEQYKYIKHRSGLDICVLKKEMSVTYALLCVKFGSAYYRYYDASGDIITLPDGTAHFLEHKMFENSDGSDSFEKFTALGADSNAYTTHNRTVYLFNCTENFEPCLEELLTFVMSPSFKEDSVEREKGIIGQEILMYEDNPYDKCYEVLLKAMYEKNPVRRNVCGSIESIESITPNVLYECWNSFYTADNMILVVCGNVDENTVYDVANRTLKNDSREMCRRCSAPDMSVFDESDTVYKKSDSIQMPISRPILCIGCKITDNTEDCKERQKHEIALMILNELIFSHSGELYERLYTEKLISSWFSSSLTYTRDFSNITVSTETDRPEEVGKLILDYVEKVRRTGISDEDFERCRRVVYSEFIASFDSTEETAENLLDSVMNGVDLFDYAEFTNSITREYSESILQKYIREECIASIVIYPKG